MKDIRLQHFITALQPRGLRIMPVHSIYRCGEPPVKAGNRDSSVELRSWFTAREREKIDH